MSLLGASHIQYGDYLILPLSSITVAPCKGGPVEIRHVPRGDNVMHIHAPRIVSDILFRSGI